MSYAKRVDSNQVELVEYARLLGASVEHLHKVGGGVPDLCIGYEGKNYLCEVKTQVGKLNELQVQFHTNWLGQCCVIRTKEDLNFLLKGEKNWRI